MFSWDTLTPKDPQLEQYKYILFLVYKTFSGYLLLLSLMFYSFVIFVSISLHVESIPQSSNFLVIMFNMLMPTNKTWQAEPKEKSDNIYKLLFLNNCWLHSQSYYILELNKC